MMQRPRPSTIPEDERIHKGTDEWFTTEDGQPFKLGDRVYNYYDCKWVTVVSGPDRNGWFDVQDENGNRLSLNSVRMASKEK